MALFSFPRALLLTGFNTDVIRVLLQTLGGDDEDDDEEVERPKPSSLTANIMKRL